MSSQTYTVTGMTCGHCVAHVSEEMREIPGVSDVDITLESGRMVVTSDEPLDFDRVKAAVAEAGEYAVVED